MPQNVNESQRENEAHTYAKDVERIKSATPESLADVLLQENAHTAAIILCLLDEEGVSPVLENFPEEKRNQVFLEIARGERILGSVLELVVSDIRKKLDEYAERNYTTLGGPDFANGILLKMEANVLQEHLRQDLFCSVNKASPSLAKRIHGGLFFFNDLVSLDDLAIQKLLREIDSTELSRALYSCDEAVKEKILKNMSKRAAEYMRDEISLLHAVPKVAVRESQNRIVRIVRRLEDSGDIEIPQNWDEGEN